MESNGDNAYLVEMFANMPFCKLLGLDRDSFDPETASITFSKRQELLRGTPDNILHGGVIAAILDTAGAFALGLSTYQHVRQAPRKNKKLTGGGTVDLRIDYLRPATGNSFTVSTQIIRTGTTVIVIQTELRNDLERLIAVGTATYILSD